MRTRRTLIAFFFLRLVYWQRRAVIMSDDDGLPWIAKTYAEWAEEFGCRPLAVKLMFKDLRIAGAISCKVDWFQGVRMLHTRVPKTYSGGCLKDTVVDIINILPSYTQESYRRLSMGEKDLTSLSSNSGKPKKGYSDPVKKETDPRPTIIIETWCGVWIEAYPGEAADGISTSAREKQDIVRWCNDVADEKKDKNLGIAEDYVRAAIENWEEFVDTANKRFGFKTGPERPAWWFFKKYWRVLDLIKAKDDGDDDWGKKLPDYA